MFVPIKCPYCGVSQAVSLNTRKQHKLARCELAERILHGQDIKVHGCGKLYVINYKVRIDHSELKLEDTE